MDQNDAPDPSIPVESNQNQNKNENQTSQSPTNESPPPRSRRQSLENEEVAEAILSQFPKSRTLRRLQKAARTSTVAMSRLILNDPTSTLRATTKAQAKLGYSQGSATLTWQNISCDNDNKIRLFPICGYIKPKQMLCLLGGGDESGIPDLFRILKDPSNLYERHDGALHGHGDILLNGLPPGKFYSRYV